MAQFRHKGVIDQRRDDVKRIGDMTVKVTRVSGRLLVQGTGEISVSVNFPVRFTERPIFTFGGELDLSSSPVAGSFPSVSCVVVNWDKIGVVTGGSDGHYIGATLAVTAGGSATQGMWIHWVMEGKAIRNPYSSGNSLDATL
jgi:hypothetical protein